MSQAKLPAKDHTFTIDLIGDETGKKYQGKFTIKNVLNIGEKVQLEREISRFLSDYQNPTDNLKILATAIANIKMHIISYPDFWNIDEDGLDIEDNNLIFHIFEKIMETKQKRYEEISKAASKANEETKEVKEDKAPLD
jgi:hypothetical protein